MPIELIEEPQPVAIDTDDFLRACTPPVLSDSDILDCFNATPVGDGRGGYLVAVGRAIETKVVREGLERRLELVGYRWGGCLYRAEETHAYHRDEGEAIYALRPPAGSVPAHSISEYKRRVAQGDADVLPPSEVPHGVVPSSNDQRKEG